MLLLVLEDDITLDKLCYWNRWFLRWFDSEHLTNISQRQRES